jgi:hypothetical protein
MFSNAKDNFSRREAESAEEEQILARLKSFVKSLAVPRRNKLPVVGRFEGIAMQIFINPIQRHRSDGARPRLFTLALVRSAFICIAIPSNLSTATRLLRFQIPCLPTFNPHYSQEEMNRAIIICAHLIFICGKNAFLRGPSRSSRLRGKLFGCGSAALSASAVHPLFPG